MLPRQPHPNRLTRGTMINPVLCSGRSSDTGWFRPGEHPGSGLEEPATMFTIWTRLRSLARRKLIVVPAMAGIGGYCLASSYSPSRWLHGVRHRGPSDWPAHFPASVDASLVAFGLALLAAALVIALQRD